MNRVLHRSYYRLMLRLCARMNAAIHHGRPALNAPRIRKQD
jgi:hypothetical protein